MILTDEDNEILWEIMSNFNKDVPISQKISLDAYVTQIDITDDDTILHCVGIPARIPEGCSDKNINANVAEVGSRFTISLNIMSSDVKAIVHSFIRELKLKTALYQ